MGLLLSDLECLFSVTNRAVVYVCMYLVCYPPPPTPTPAPLILSAVCKHLELTWDGAQEISSIRIQYFFISYKAYTQLMWLWVPERSTDSIANKDKEGLWVPERSTDSIANKDKEGLWVPERSTDSIANKDKEGLWVPERSTDSIANKDKEGLWIHHSAQGAHADKILHIPLMALTQHRPSTLKLLPCRYANWTWFVALSVKLKKSQRK